MGVFFVVVSDLDKRFINEDSYQGSINNPLTLNLYTYVGNNPLNRWDPTGHSWISDQWSNLKKGIGMVTSKENWEKSGAAAAAGWNRSADLISNMNWNEAFGSATNDFKKGFSMYLVGTIGEDKYNTLNDGKWTVEDAGIIFMAYISFRAAGGATAGTKIPWTSSAVRKAATSLEKGSTDITVANRSQAEELYLGLYQGKGYKNTTGMSATESKNYFGKKGTYHWDDDIGADGRISGHGIGNPHGDLPHLQIHDSNGQVIRIFYSP